MKQILYYLLAGTRGGPTRAQLLRAIKQDPRNAHQLSQHLGYDYKTITYHLQLLEKHGLIQATGDYGALYFLSDALTEHWDDYGEIWERVGKT